MSVGPTGLVIIWPSGTLTLKTSTYLSAVTKYLTAAFTVLFNSCETVTDLSYTWRKVGAVL